MFTEKKVPVNGHYLNLAQSERTGPPLMFLHGVSRCWQDFLSLMPMVASRWQVFGLDHRGHGRSDRQGKDYLVRHYLHDTCRTLKRHLEEPTVLFGHSLGALVALGAAATFPERVRAIVLEDPPSAAFLANLQETPYHAQFEQMQALARTPTNIAELTNRLMEMPLPTAQGTVKLGELRDATSLRFSARCLLHLDPEVYPPLLANRWLEGIDLTSWCEQTRCPVLVLRGNSEMGGMLPRADAEAMVAKMPEGYLVDVPGVGHLIHQLDPQSTLRLTTGFLESLR